jgi:hypothetical protein
MIKIKPICIGAFLGFACSIASASEPILRAAGPSVTLYSAASSGCDKNFIPDAPARAFRRKDGSVVVTAPHYDNWILHGDGLLTVKPDCHGALLKSAYRQSVSGNLWIEATFTDDGQYVFALASQDLTDENERNGCKPKAPGGCWSNNIVSLDSPNGGESYNVKSIRPFATANMNAISDSKRSGYFTTSNISSVAGVSYFLLYSEGLTNQPPGNCLFRSNAPTNPSSWFGWDGNAFTIQFFTSSLDFRPCKPIMRVYSPARSLVYIPKYRTWITVFTARLKDQKVESQSRPGFYASLSDDLKKWSDPVLLLQEPLVPRLDSGDYIASYPSLIDPKSASQNFDSLDDTEPVLFFTVQHLSKGSGTMNRDLVYAPLTLLKQ